MAEARPTRKTKAAVPAPAAPPRAPYQPSPAEIEAVRDLSRRRKARIGPPQFEIARVDKAAGGSVGVLNYVVNDPVVGDASYLGALGATHRPFADMLMNQLGRLDVRPGGEASIGTLNGLMQAMWAFQPADEVEGQIASLAVAMQYATMEALRRAHLAEQSFEARGANMAHANKCARTFATLVETLNKHRGKGQQKVTVEHVHVHEGGQAIVGAVAHGGGEGRREG